MRLLVAMTILALATVSSCSVDRKSKDFDCSDSMPCGSDRMCENGFCVLLDAMVCGKNCTDVGGECMGQTCTFDCGVASCPPIQCPPSLACVVNCTEQDACSSTTISCGSAPSCAINCSGPDSCSQRLVTGTGSTSVTCSGADSCAGGTDCDDACSCTVSCNGAGACGAPADCHGTSNMCANGNGCSLGGNCKNDC